MGEADHSGISVLIPIYNYDVVSFVAELSKQGSHLKIPFEIICIDDCSDELWKVKNRNGLMHYSTVVYQELEYNVGRSKIRNLLAKTARFSSLIFLDCDSGLHSNKFLETYWRYHEHPVVVGGRAYSLNLPEDPDYFLHWTIGSARETMNASKRSLQPYKSFMFNNVCIQKKCFLEILLDEQIKTYGHEDTKFGYLLEQKKIPILHIDNSTLHIGLDRNEAFLHKTKEGIKNLFRLTEQGFGRDTKLFQYYSILKSIYGLKVFLIVYNTILKKKVERNLRSYHPSLVYFDLYKLAAFIIEAN